MEEKIQQVYLRLLEESKIRGEHKKIFASYKTLLSDDLSSINPKTKTYLELKKLKEKLIAFIETTPTDVHQLEYPDYSRVSSAVRATLKNIASDSYGKEFYEFMITFKEPSIAIIKNQPDLFVNENLSKRYVLHQGLRCFADCIKNYLPMSDCNNSLTYMLYMALERIERDLKAKDLYYYYMAKADENKRLHINDKYKEFLDSCFKKNARLYNAIKSKYGDEFKPEILLLENERGKLNSPGVGKRVIADLGKLMPTFLDNVREVLSSNDLPNLVDGADTWLHRLERQEVKVVPFEVDEEISLAKQFEIALEQAVQYLKHQKSKNQKYYGGVLANFLKDGMRLDEMSSSTTPERKKQILCNFVQRQKLGPTTYKDLEFSETLKTQIEEIVEAKMYHPKEELVKALGIEREQVFYVLSLALGDNPPIIMSNLKKKMKKGIVDLHLKCLKDSLQALLFPASIEIILRDVKERLKKEKNDIEFIKEVILQDLDNNPAVEQVGDRLYQLKKEELGKAVLIQGRIMYEINDWRTKEEIEQIYWQQFPESKERFQASGLSKFESKVSPTMGFIKLGKTGKWRFTEDKDGHEEDVAKLLEKCLKEKELVNIDEVMDFIKKNDMPYDKGTIRTYLLGMCYVDETGTTFVLSNKKDQYPTYSWKRKYRGDSTNWTVNRSVEILKKQPRHKMAYKLFREELLRFAKEEGYRSAVIEIIKSYDGEGKLFIRKDDIIELNMDVLEKTNLKFEGLYRKDPHYMDIFSYTFNALGHEKDGQLALTELVNRITGQTEVTIDEKTVRHAFDKDAIIPDGLERLTIEGRVYIRLVNARANDEDEQYKVDNTAPITNEDVPSLVVDTVERPAVTYQTVFTWAELREAMKRELAFYDNWDDGNHITSEPSLDKFQRFMEGSRNQNLKVMIPQDMYDNWFAFTNRYYTYHYFTDIALNFEALLKDICRRNGKDVAGNGLVEICQEHYPEYYNAIRNQNVTNSRYNKVMKDLHYNRNQICHGDGNPVEMTSRQMMLSILNFIALYIRTVVKYYNE